MRHLAALMLVLGLLLLACGAAPTTPQTTIGSPVANVAAATATVSPAYSLAVVAIADPSDALEFHTPEPNTRTVGVEVVLANVAGGETFVNPMAFILVDAGGYLYRADLTATMAHISFTTLFTGDKVRGWVGFTVPEAAVLAYVRWEIGGGTVQAAIVR